MRYGVLALALAATSGAVVAQDQPSTSAWGFFEADGGANGASVEGEDGSHLVLKCDKPGSREVYAIVLTADDRLVPPNDRPYARGITFQFDGRAPKTENWGFFERYAIAQGKTSDRALARFIISLRGASRVQLRLDAATGADVEMDFNVTGATEAIGRVYEICKDTPPT